MSKSTSGADLFRWAESRRRAASRKASRWAPKRRNGFAAALAVVVEAGRSGVTAPSIRLSSASYRSAAIPRSPASRAQLPVATASTSSTQPAVRAVNAAVVGELFAPAPVAAPVVDARCGTSADPAVRTARCPRCGVEGEVAAQFGFRKVDGKRRAQSWCRACRRSARTVRSSGMVEEAQQYARQAVRETGLSELPLWSSSAEDER